MAPDLPPYLGRGAGRLRQEMAGEKTAHARLLAPPAEGKKRRMETGQQGILPEIAGGSARIVNEIIDSPGIRKERLMDRRIARKEDLPILPFQIKMVGQRRVMMRHR
jgi:hypothetical protein